MTQRGLRTGLATLVGMLIISGGVTSSASASASHAAHTSSPATFVAASLYGRSIGIARARDGKVIRKIRLPRQAAGKGTRTAMRAPGGGLLVTSHNPDVSRNTRTGVKFPGLYPRVSPDGRRIATYVTPAGRKPSIRQYEARTGRVLWDIAANAAGDSYSDISGFDWAPGSKRLVVALAPHHNARGGLYVVHRDARVLPTKPRVPNAMISGQWTVLRSPAVLSNGHVVAFRNVGSWDRVEAGEIDDINLRTRKVHNVLGKIGVGFSLPRCYDRTTATPLPVNQLRRCTLFLGGLVDASGNQALITDGEYSTWHYNGQTSRFVAPNNFAAYW